MKTPRVSLLTALLVLLVMLPATAASRGLLYENKGDTMKGLEVRLGGSGFVVEHETLLGQGGGAWYALPVLTSGDFTLDYDVLADLGDATSFVVLCDDQSNAGIKIFNSPQGSYTPQLHILQGVHLNAHQPFYFEGKTLVSVPTTHFLANTWTHVTVSRKGNILTDNVGGQIVTVDLSKIDMPKKVRLGFGFYATKNVGGEGKIYFAHLRVTAGAKASAPAPKPPKPVPSFFPAPDLKPVSVEKDSDYPGVD